MLDSMPALSATFCAIAVAALLTAEVKHSHVGIWVTKPIASTLFIATALFAGALASPFGQLILLVKEQNGLVIPDFDPYCIQ